MGLRVLSPAAKGIADLQGRVQNRMGSRVERLGAGLVNIRTSIKVREKFKRCWTLTIQSHALTVGAFLPGAFLPGAPCDVRGALFENTLAKTLPKVKLLGRTY